MLPLGRKNARKCTECDLTCHASCTHLVPDFCGMPMETANLLLAQWRTIDSNKRQRQAFPTSSQVKEITTQLEDSRLSPPPPPVPKQDQPPIPMEQAPPPMGQVPTLAPITISTPTAQFAPAAIPLTGGEQRYPQPSQMPHPYNPPPLGPSAPRSGNKTPVPPSPVGPPYRQDGQFPPLQACLSCS